MENQVFKGLMGLGKAKLILPPKLPRFFVYNSSYDVRYLRGQLSIEAYHGHRSLGIAWYVYGMYVLSDIQHLLT